MNIVDAILFQCRHHPPAPAICSPGEELSLISYARLEGFIHSVTRKAMSLNLSRGQVAAIYIQNPIVHAAVALGLTRLGVITLAHRDLAFPKELRVDVIIAEKPIGTPVAGRVHIIDQTWIEGDEQPSSDPALARTKDTDLCRIVLTSGTTGEPKAVGLTHGMMAARIGRHTYMLGNRFSHCSRLYCDLGLSTSLGFQFLVYMLWRGGTIFFAGESAEATIQAFELYKVQAMLASPAGLSGFVKFYEMHSPFQGSFDMVMAAGSILPRSLSERARARLCANLVSAYGSTEASMVATAPAQVIAHIPGAVGYVIPDVGVEIVDDGGRAVPAGAEGRLRIAGPYNTNGYLGGQDGAEEAFHDGWFYPGDLGYLTRERILVISGREKTILNVGGEKVKPEVVETVITSFFGVEQAAAFVVRNEFGIDELCAAVVAPQSVNTDQLRSHCERLLSRSCVPARFFIVQGLPRNEMGKLERPKLADAVAAHVPQSGAVTAARR